MTSPDSDKRLVFLRRMIWWLPVFVFAVLATFYIGFNQRLVGGNFWGYIVDALIPAIGVAILCLLLYFGYRYWIGRSPNS